MELQHAPTQGGTPDAIEDLFNRLNAELVRMIGLSSSVRAIGEDLPTTSHENDGTLCPELVFPCLANGLIAHGNNSMSLVEALHDLLRGNGTLSTGFRISKPTVDRSTGGAV